MSYQLTASQLATLDAMMREELADAQKEAELKTRKDARRAALQELFDFAGLDNKAVAGVVIQTKTDIVFDEAEALAYALDELNFAHAAPLLAVRKDAVGVVIAAAMNDDRLKGVFELDKTGYKAAARNASHVGLPVTGATEQKIVAITLKNVKTGDELARDFVIVADEDESEVA